MPNRISRISDSIKQLGEIQVNDWDFMALLNKDIKELEIGHSLRKLGNIRVMEWDFKKVMPAVDRFANQEVDLLDLVKRTANYKIMEWDFRSALPPERVEQEVEEAAPAQASAASERVATRLKNFLQFVALGLINEPEHAQIKVQEIAKDVLRFKLVLVKRDVALLIGREGRTAMAMRNILKATASLHGVQALLQIHSHEEEMALKLEAGD
jgi:uncharacterized protein